MTKKVEKKNIYKILFWALVFLIAASSLLFAGYWYGKNFPLQSNFPKISKEKEETPKPKETAFEKLDDWQTYVNQRFHYSLKYPPELTLEPLGEGDNPFTEAIEVGDEGTFIVEPSTTPGEMSRSMVVNALYLSEANKNLTLKEFVETQGSFINPCHEDKPERTEEVTTQSGLKGIKAWYWVKEGCQGSQERSLNDPSVFFDARPRGEDVLIEFFEGQLDEYFDTIVSTFTFIKPIEYGD